MQIVARKLSELHKLDRNVRRHNDKQLNEYVRSLKMFGQIRPIIIDEHDTILCGNGMYDALVSMGAETCECHVEPDLSENKKIKLMLADNRVYELGMTDIDIFDDLIRELGDDIDVPGWDEDLLQTLQASTPDADEMVSSYGIYDQDEVDRVSERKREDHDSYVPPEQVAATPGAAQAPSGAAQPSAQGSDSSDAQTATAPAETLSEGFIICPHCGTRILIPREGGA